MSPTTPGSISENEKSAVRQMLHWATDHPGTLILGTLAVGTYLACRIPKQRQLAAPERRTETEADCVDGETPLFV